MILLFPGQGSQKVGMVQALAKTYDVVRETFREADDLLGFSLSTLCFEGPEDELNDTINTQPALLVAGVAIVRAINAELQAKADGDSAGGLFEAGSVAFVAGHSLGEYTALVAADSMTYPDALTLVRERGRLMKEAGERSPGMMAALLGLNQEQVAAICEEVVNDDPQNRVVQIANDNCPGQLVISGNQAGMEAAMMAAKEAKARKVVQLAVSIAAHSPLMMPAAEQLRAAIEQTEILAPRVPLIANTSATPLTTPDQIRAELIAQLTGSVMWTDSMNYAISQEVTQFVELGPEDVLTGMMKRIMRKSKRQAVNTPESVASFVDSLLAEAHK